MGGAAKAVLAFLVGRPLIAVAIAAVVIGVLVLVETRGQKTAVTHREQRVSLTDAQQMQLGSQEYAKTLRASRAQIVSSGAKYVVTATPPAMISGREGQGATGIPQRPPERRPPRRADPGLAARGRAGLYAHPARVTALPA